jgi:hypothetical protein
MTGSDSNANVRFGPGGIDLLEQLAQGRLSPEELAGGPGGNIWAEIIQSMDPLTSAVASVVREKDFSEIAPAVEHVLRNISTVNNAVTSIEAWNSLTLRSKSDSSLFRKEVGEGLLSDLTPAEAALIGLGIRPRRNDDTFRFLDKTNLLQNSRNALRKEFQLNMRKSLEAPDQEEAQKYRDRANAAWQLGFRPDEAPRLFKEFLRSTSTSLFTKARQNATKKGILPVQGASESE